MTPNTHLYRRPNCAVCSFPQTLLQVVHLLHCKGWLARQLRSLRSGFFKLIKKNPPTIALVPFEAFHRHSSLRSLCTLRSLHSYEISASFRPFFPPTLRSTTTNNPQKKEEKKKLSPNRHKSAARETRSRDPLEASQAESHTTLIERKNTDMASK